MYTFRIKPNFHLLQRTYSEAQNACVGLLLTQVIGANDAWNVHKYRCNRRNEIRTQQNWATVKTQLRWQCLCLRCVHCLFCGSMEINGVARNVNWGSHSHRFFPFSLFSPFLSSRYFSFFSLPLEVWPLNSSKEVWGSAVSSPSGNWGGVVAEIKLGAINYGCKICNLVATILTFFIVFCFQF